MRSSVVISAFVAVLVGFGGSVAVVLAAAETVGATPGQTSSWIAMLCLAMMVTTAVLSFRHRMPIVTAWSTPGAALIAASSGLTMETAVGAFFLTSLLILLTALFRPLGLLVERIPTTVASAMLAGVIFSFVVAIFDHLPDAPGLILPLLFLFVVARLFSPAWAVLAVLGLGIALTFALGMTAPLGPLRFSSFFWVAPRFEWAALLGVGLPLYLVTMASQNLPGFAVLKAAGYRPPARSILGVTGLASLVTAGFCAHTSNLAAITASICTGPDAHPDPHKRWLCGPFYAAGYGLLALAGASVVAFFDSFPQALIVTVAGIALAGPLVGSLGTALSMERERFAAVAAFVVTASGVSLLGIGAAFWGLLAGLLAIGLEKLFSRRTT
jgi:benzoate membrane transport protein